MKRPIVVFFVTLFVSFGLMVLWDDSSNKEDSKDSAPLDFAKPIFTISTTVVCPVSLLFDPRADHSPDKIVDMFYSIWTRDEKAKALGCEELQADIPVTAKPLQDGFALLNYEGGANSNWFTITSELTNKIPGLSESKRKELAEPEINNAPSSMSTSSDASIATAGKFLVNTPFQEPILKGTGVVAEDSTGFGALICPNSSAFASLVDSEVNALDKSKQYNEKDARKAFGCSYIPPGTSIVSEGPNQQRSLAIVSARLSDGTVIRGVTFPKSFKLSSIQPDTSLSIAMPEQNSSMLNKENKTSASGAAEDALNKARDPGPFRPGENGVGYPVCIYCPDPKFPSEAQSATIEGTVVLQAVIEAEGNASNITIVKGLGYGLDEAAVQAIQSWRFKPAIGRDGVGVPVSVPIEVNFKVSLQ